MKGTRYKKKFRSARLGKSEPDWRTIAIIAAAAAVVVSVIFLLSCVSCAHGDNERGPGAVLTEAEPENPNLLPQSVKTYPRILPGGSENMVSPDYAPSDLTPLLGVANGSSILMRFDAATAFKSMSSAMVKDGMAVVPLVGYRSFDDMVELYNSRMIELETAGMAPAEAMEIVKGQVGWPGADEHQLGYSIEVSTKSKSDEKFMSTDQGQWLARRAHEFGFILRYPADKEEITGRHVPGELRYVGAAVAAFMRQRGFCLEEYVDYVKLHRPGAEMED